jgi:protein O-mannosyl-transferase
MPLIAKNRSYIFIFFLLLYIAIIYSNTFQVPFILDDRINIVQRPNLHISKLTIHNIVNTFFEPKEHGKKLYRPISCGTLALNYYIGKFNVTGYHIINLLIHLFTSIFLFKTLQLILNLKPHQFNKSQAKSVAALATILWAAHPIQTQSVTYIIQRMASLSAMFYILGIWLYLKFRSSMINTHSTKIKWLLFSFLFFMCAVLSKENAVIFPFSLILIEFFFFNGLEKIKANPLKAIFILLFLLIIPVVFFFHTTNLEKIISGYNHRPFTLTQRLLTEPRIIFFYISQLLYPVPDRFSISHSFLTSSSFLSPVTTLLSAAGLLAIFITAVAIRKKQPLVGFSIIFYFLHHIVESSFIPLELIYEHRNYLPSLFFFLPISYGLIKLLIFYQKEKKYIYYFLFIFCTFIIFLFGMSTYLRNNAWQSHESLWQHAIKNSPDLIRPYSQLGWYHTNKKRLNTSKALFYFKQGIDKNESYSVFEKAILWLNIAMVYEHANHLTKANSAALNSLKIFNNQIKQQPLLIHKTHVKKALSNIHYYLGKTYFYLGNIQNAVFHIDESIKLHSNPAFYNAKAKYLIYLKKYDLANKILQTSLSLNHDNQETLLLLGKTLTFLNNYSSGFWFYKLALQKNNKRHNNSMIYLYLAENRYLSKQMDSGDLYINNFTKLNSMDTIKNLLKNNLNQSFDILPFANSKTITDKLYIEIKSIFKDI